MAKTHLWFEESGSHLEITKWYLNFLLVLYKTNDLGLNYFFFLNAIKSVWASVAVVATLGQSNQTKC